MDITKLHQTLFDTRKNVYSVIDGATLPGLLAKLEEHQPTNTCLFRGELPFDLAEAAPYLVKLEKDSDFSKWLLQENTEIACCIYAHSEEKFITLRKYFRSFLKVESSKGKKMLFRYYDPRVMEAYLPTCNEEENEIMFKPIESYLIVSKTDAKMTHFRKAKN